MSLPPTSQQHLPPQSLEVDATSIDFGVTTIPSASLEGDINITTFMIEVRNRLCRLEAAHAEIAQLKSALTESQAACHTLEVQLAAVTVTPTSNLATPTTTTTATTTANTTAAATATTTTPGDQSSFASVASNAGKKRKKKPAPPPLPSMTKASATIGRLFGPQSDIPSGYQFVYFKTSVRRRLSELRRLIQAVGLNNSRVLDIQYPVPNVASFLVHNDYVLTFTSAMHQNGRGCSPLVEFDPSDHTNLKDPKFASLSPALRAQKAIEIENLRCLRSLSFVRRPVRISVARSFLSYDRINQAQFDAILSEELSARSSSSAARPSSKSSDQERLVKKQRLRYLGYLLHHDTETASLLAYAKSPVISPAATADSPMTDLSAI